MSKHAQIVRFIDLGFSRKQTALLVGCKEPYVRAVLAREFGNGLETERRYIEKNRVRKSTYQKAWRARRQREARA